MALDRTGTFRCKPLEWGIGISSKAKLPQFVVRVCLTEVYDQKEEQWFDYSEFEAEISGYLILYAKNKKSNQDEPTLTYQQVMKIFGWDGISFLTLNAGDYSELEFQVRITDNTYEGAKTPYQVAWIDVYDADPAVQLRKLDTAEIKELDKQYVALARKTKPVTAISAKKTPESVTVTRVPGTAGPVETVQPDTKEEKQRKLKEKSERIKAAAKAKKTTPPEPPKPTSPIPTEMLEGKCTKQVAWETIVEMRDPEIDDTTIGEVWNNAIAEIAGPDVDQTLITEEQWFSIREAVLSEVGIF